MPPLLRDANSGLRVDAAMTRRGRSGFVIRRSWTPLRAVSVSWSWSGGGSIDILSVGDDDDDALLDSVIGAVVETESAVTGTGEETEEESAVAGTVEEESVVVVNTAGTTDKGGADEVDAATMEANVDAAAAGAVAGAVAGNVAEAEAGADMAEVDVAEAEADVAEAGADAAGAIIEASLATVSAQFGIAESGSVMIAGAAAAAREAFRVALFFRRIWSRGESFVFTFFFVDAGPFKVDNLREEEEATGESMSRARILRLFLDGVERRVFLAKSSFSSSSEVETSWWNKS